MAFIIRQHNFDKPPTAEQRKVFIEAWSMGVEEIPTTRIEAHLKIAALKKEPRLAELLSTWRTRRSEARRARRESNAESR